MGEAVDDTEVIDNITRLIVLVGRPESTIVGIEDGILLSSRG